MEIRGTKKIEGKSCKESLTTLFQPGQCVYELNCPGLLDYYNIRQNRIIVTNYPPMVRLRGTTIIVINGIFILPV